jgi:CRP-like cAMP-binding protein
MTAQALAASPASALLQRLPTVNGHLPLSPEEEASFLGAACFGGIPQEVGRALLSMAGVRHLSAGRTMARTLANADEWYGVARGVLKLCSRTVAGKRVIVSLAEPGDWFGNIPLIDEPRPLHDAEACSPTTLLVLHKSDLQLLLQRHPPIGMVLARVHSARARDMTAAFTNAVSLPLQQRVALQLLTLTNRFGSPGQHGMRISVRLSQQDLADLLGASRQRVNEVLKRFERQGLIRVEPSGILVASAGGLEAAAALDE